MHPYEKKKGTGKKQKFQSNSNMSSSSSSRQKQDSTSSQKLCYRCKKSFTKGHEKVCKALNAKCNACGIVGHFEVACKKSGNFPQKSSSKFQKPGSTGRMNIASAVEEPALQADFFDEKGLLKEYQPKSMHVLSGTSNDKPIMIEFGCGLTPLSFDRKLTLQADTGADANAINKRTFNEVFPDVELEESTYVLQNFDKRLIKPIGSFRCFLRWKGHKYRVKFEVMGIDTPNLLSRETTFLMGILKKCLSVEKTPNEPNNQISSTPVSGHLVLLTEKDPLTSTEGVFSHSVPPMEEDPLTSMEDRSQMNCASISNMAESPESSSDIGLPGVTGIADDMVIFGRNEEEHDRNLILFLETTRKNGLVLNKRKLQFKKEEVSFFGHRWNSTGISPDPKKTESILKMQFPPDKETMHSFLGLVNFLNRYTPRLAELCSPLRKLILKDSHYSPGDPEHAAFDAIKAEFQKKIILPYFDRNKETILQTDASKKGFAAVILQEEQPVYYALRALTSAEKNYQNLEREAQAAVWGMEKFHYFLYGRKFILQTDQKPLFSIFRKHMIDVSPRIRRIAIRAWQYKFEPQHIPGRNNVISDALSRVTPLEFQDSNIEKDILAVNFLQYSSIEERERDEMLQETNKDEELQSLKHYISTGWPAKRSQILVSLHPYWNFRDELTVESGILMKNSKVLIPDTLKQKYLKQIHQGHQGIEACR